jgi:rhomboid protease GluP
VTGARRFPWLTLAVLVGTSTVSIVALVDRPVLQQLERHAGEVTGGEPWRLVTSLLVHDSWVALVANLVLLALVGAAVERRRSRVAWITLYAAGGLVGEVVGLAWQPHGAGNSVAAFGLVGALAIDAIRRRDARVVPLGYAVLVMATLVAADIGGGAGVVLAVAAYLVPGASIAATRGDRTRLVQLVPELGWVALAIAAVLTALGNIHGPAMLAGAAVAVLWRERGGAGSDRAAPRPVIAGEPGRSTRGPAPRRRRRSREVAAGARRSPARVMGPLPFRGRPPRKAAARGRAESCPAH